MLDQKGNVYYAISHPERRKILQSLRIKDSPAMDLPVTLSPSALSQHLTVLKQANLVSEHREGRQRIYSLNPEPLFEPFEWLAQYEMFWQVKFEQLNQYLEKHHGRQQEND